MYINCPICDSLSRKAFEVEDRTVWKCSNCKLRFIWPQPSDASLAKYYEEDYYDFAQPKHDETDSAIYAQMVTYLLKLTYFVQPVLLDFGCARGGLWQTFPEDIRLNYFDIETNEKVRTAAEENTGRPIYSSVYKFSEKSGFPWHICVMNQVVEHLRTPLSQLSELHSMGAANSLLFLAMPNLSSAKALLLGRKWREYRNRTLLFFFNRRSCSELLRRAGFRDITEACLTIRYPKMGTFRMLAQRVLRRLRLDGNLTQTARK